MSRITPSLVRTGESDVGAESAVVNGCDPDDVAVFQFRLDRCDFVFWHVADGHVGDIVLPLFHGGAQLGVIFQIAVALPQHRHFLNFPTADFLRVSEAIRYMINRSASIVFEIPFSEVVNPLKVISSAVAGAVAG